MAFCCRLKCDDFARGPGRRKKMIRIEPDVCPNIPNHISRLDRTQQCGAELILVAVPLNPSAQNASESKASRDDTKSKA